MDIVQDRFVTTRKHHICDLCQRMIGKGSRMRYCFFVDGGDNWSWYGCDTCMSIMNELARQKRISPGDDWEQGLVREMCSEYRAHGHDIHVPEDLLQFLKSE